MIEGTACSYCGLIDVHAAWCAHEAARRDDLKLLEVIDRQLEIERKARAWDEWRRRVGKADMYITWEGEPLALLLERLERTA